jgi:nucleoside-diphosphate-sugar epimerase
LSNALVTGGAGYFGEVLVRKLVARGDTVRVFDLNPAQNVESIQGDIRDARAVLEACKGIDVAFHNVAQVPLAKDKNLFWTVNRDGTENLLKACAASSVRKTIYTSSSAVYGAPKQNPVSESTAPAPAEEYGRAKLAGEKLCLEYAAKGLDVSIIRPRTIMGHGRLGIFQILFEWIFQGKNVPVLNGGANVYQFVHADDLADACILASDSAGPDTFNCGADRFGTMREVLEHLVRHAGTGSKVKSLPMWPAVGAMKVASAVGASPLGAYHALMYGRSMYFDISHARSKLGWTPRFSNNEMFVETYDWYVKNRDAILSSSRAASRHQSVVEQGMLKLLHWFL